MEVHKTPRLAEGSCSACSDRKDDDVYLVALTMISFRLCKKCKRELIEMLRKEK
jgi:hypothetical protein